MSATVLRFVRLDLTVDMVRMKILHSNGCCRCTLCLEPRAPLQAVYSTTLFLFPSLPPCLHGAAQVGIGLLSTRARRRTTRLHRHTGGLRVCVRACVRACVLCRTCACVRVCGHDHVCVCAAFKSFLSQSPSVIRIPPRASPQAAAIRPLLLQRLSLALSGDKLAAELLLLHLLSRVSQARWSVMMCGHGTGQYGSCWQQADAVLAVKADRVTVACHAITAVNSVIWHVLLCLPYNAGPGLLNEGCTCLTLKPFGVCPFF